MPTRPAYDVARGQVFGRCEPTTGITALDASEHAFGETAHSTLQLIDNAWAVRSRGERLTDVPMHGAWLRATG